eukprot:Skav216020  [mRNA]  locus=scaffold417:67364:69331:+ [translate_table: standard]
MSVTVQAVLLSSSFVRDAFRGILRARVLSAEGDRAEPWHDPSTETPRKRSTHCIDAMARFGMTVVKPGFQRNSVRRGVLNGVAQWLDEEHREALVTPRFSSDVIPQYLRLRNAKSSQDDSVYLYVPKGALADAAASEDEVPPAPSQFEY